MLRCDHQSAGIVAIMIGEPLLNEMPSRILCKGVEQESMETRLGELMRMNGGETTRVRMKPAGL